MKKVILEILLLAFISSLVVFFRFNQIPKKISLDEAEFANLALALNKKVYIPYSPLATGHSTLYFYVILLSFKIFGVNNFALRFPSAIFAIVCVLLFYLIIKNVFPKLPRSGNIFLNKIYLLPLFLSFILATNRWFFNFARFSFEATFLLFLELTSIFFFLKWRNNKRHLNLILSSLFAGFSFLSYYPGRIFFILPLFFLSSFKNRNKLRINLTIFLITLFLITLPLTSYLLTHKDIRFEEQLFLIDKKLSITNKINFVFQNAEKLLLMFNVQGDLNGRHNYPGKPMLNPIVGAFFIFGFLVTLLNLKNFYNQFFLSYFILCLLPALFTYPVENPNTLRTFTVIVPSIYFVANGIIYLLKFGYNSKLFYTLIFAIVITIFIFSSLYDLRTYFVYQPKVFNDAFDLKEKLITILKLRLWENTRPL